MFSNQCQDKFSRRLMGWHLNGQSINRSMCISPSQIGDGHIIPVKGEDIVR
jgi:hypothetical protein